MIGRFTIPWTTIVCTLDDDLHWQAPGPPTLQSDLSCCFDATLPPYSSAAAGGRGCLALSEAAAAFGAFPEFSGDAEEPGDLVFIEEPDGTES